MGRFNHLEMSNLPPDLEPVDPNSGARDEYYYRDKANEAFACEDFERALAYYSRALQYNISLEECWLGQLRCLIDLGEFQEAVVWSKRALEKFPKSAPLLAATAVAESRMGRTTTAMGYSDGSLGAAGVNAYCWLARGEVVLSQNPVNSKACFAKAIELTPKDWAVRAAIGHAYRIRRSPHQAYDYFKQAVKLEPEQCCCWYWLGKCAQNLREYDEAANAYTRALAIRPDYEMAKIAIDEIQNRGFFSRLAYAVKQSFTSK